MADSKHGDVIMMEDVQGSTAPDKDNAIATYRSYNATDLAAIERRLVRKLDIVREPRRNAFASVG